MDRLHIAKPARTLLRVALLLCALPAAANEPGWWGELSVPVFQSDRVLVNSTAEFRSDETFPRNTLLGRYTASARFPFSRGWSGRVGYVSYLRGNDLVRLGWQKALSGGISYPLGTRVLVGSTVYEHHWLPAGLGERNRLRQRVEFTWPRSRIAPWAYQDLTLENGRGPYRSRSRAGLLFNLPRAWQFRAGYQFEAFQRQHSTAWIPRHALVFSLRTPPLFDRRSKKKVAGQKDAEPEEHADQLDEE
jgi:hypothetical protein